MVNNIFYGYAEASVSHFHQAIEWCFTPNVEQYDYNLNQANTLLDAAGYPRDSTSNKRFALSIKYFSGQLPLQKMAEILRDRFEQIGIDLTLIPEETAVLQKDLYTDYAFDLTIVGVATGPDPSMAIQSTFHGKSITPGVPASNCAGYNSSEVNGLFDQATNEMSRDIRATYYHSIASILSEDLPSVPMVDYLRPGLYHNYVSGIPTDLYGGFRKSFADVQLGVQPPFALSAETLAIIAGVIIVVIVAVVLVLIRRARLKNIQA
jgi:peptide/nickel transport system substrate-binding protein